jgi:hypothetical protein
MKITRRHFLGVSTGAAALFSTSAAARGDFGFASGGRRGCVLLDLPSQCVLGESFLGYKKILAGVDVASAETLPRAISRYATIIVPGAGVIEPPIAAKFREVVQEGGVLLLESGGGFLNSKELSTHQQVLQRYLNIPVEPPADLWAKAKATGAQPRAEMRPRRQDADHRPAPYVDYVWPHRTAVRDFSHVVPLAAQAGEVIGFAGTLPVALRKRIGKGTVIFLGSPLGPHLYAGDPQAVGWLQSVLADGWNSASHRRAPENAKGPASDGKIGLMARVI